MSSTRTSAGPSARLAAPRDRTGNCTPAKESLSSLAPTAQSQRKARIAPNARYQAFLQASDSVRTSQEVLMQQAATGRPCAPAESGSHSTQSTKTRPEKLAEASARVAEAQDKTGVLRTLPRITRKAPSPKQARKSQTSSGAPGNYFCAGRCAAHVARCLKPRCSSRHTLRRHGRLLRKQAASSNNRQRFLRSHLAARLPTGA